MGMIAAYYSSDTALASGASASLPTVKDGMEVWLLCAAASTTPFVTPAGWTVVKASAGLAQGGNTWQAAIYKKTWSLGDATTVTVSGPAGGIIKTHMVSIQGNHAMPSTAVAGVPATTVNNAAVTVKQTTPADAAHDLRLMFVLSLSTNNVPTSQTPLSENGSSDYSMYYRNINNSAVAPYTQIHVGVGPQKFDSADTTITLNNLSSTVWTLPYSLTDAGGDYYVGSEDAEGKTSGTSMLELSADVGVWSLVSRTGGDDSANARWEGGGAGLLS